MIDTEQSLKRIHTLIQQEARELALKDIAYRIKVGEGVPTLFDAYRTYHRVLISNVNETLDGFERTVYLNAPGFEINCGHIYRGSMFTN